MKNLKRLGMIFLVVAFASSASAQSTHFESGDTSSLSVADLGDIVAIPGFRTLAPRLAEEVVQVLEAVSSEHTTGELVVTKEGWLFVVVSDLAGNVLGIIDVGDLPDGIIDVGDLPDGIIDVGDLPDGIIDVGDLPDGFRSLAP